MDSFALLPSERVLVEIGLALFPPCDFFEVTGAGFSLASPLLPCNSPQCAKFTDGTRHARIPLASAVRGDGIIYALSDGLFWGIIANIEKTHVFVLTPSENGVTLLRIEIVRIKEVRRYGLH